MQHLIIALDVGGSSVKHGLVSLNADVTHIGSTPIDSKADESTILGTLYDIITMQMQHVSPAEVRGIGIGFPSPFDYERGICLMKDVQKYEGIYGVDVGAGIRQRLNRADVPIHFRNDAEAAIIAECLYGAGKPYERVVGVTLGTGMGSAFVEKGVRVVRGQGVPEPDGMLFHEPYRGIQSDEWFSTRGLLARIHAARLPYADVAQASHAAEQGAEDARQIFADFGADLATFIRPWLSAFAADAFLVMGGISGAFPHFEDALSRRLHTPLVRGVLGPQAALLGAAQPFLPR